MGCHSLLQGIFRTQGSNPGLRLCRWILYRPNQGSLAVNTVPILSLFLWERESHLGHQLAPFLHSGWDATAQGLQVTGAWVQLCHFFAARSFKSLACVHHGFPICNTGFRMHRPQRSS